MASQALRLVGGTAIHAPRLMPQRLELRASGWPLSPELLAALQNADDKTRKRAEIALAIALDWDVRPVNPL